METTIGNGYCVSIKITENSAIYNNLMESQRKPRKFNCTIQAKIEPEILEISTWEPLTVYRENGVLHIVWPNRVETEILDYDYLRKKS